MSSIDKLGFWISIIGIIFVIIIFSIQNSYSAITYLNTFECFQSLQHYEQVAKNYPILYQYSKLAGLCDWGGQKIAIQVPLTLLYAKEYKKSVGVIFITPTFSARIPN